MRRGRRWQVWIVLWGLAACDLARDNESARGLVDDPCDSQGDCAGGHVCSSEGFCAEPGATGTVPEDAACAADADCLFGLVCNADGKCAERRQGAVGASCRGGDTECRDALVCDQDGKCAAAGEPGTTAEGGECAADADCAYRLVCGPESRCVALSRWAGVSCDAAGDAEGPPRVIFERPFAGGEFFRLPFPNDARANDGVIDLSGFPGLDQSPEPGDLLGRFAAAVVEQRRGFGLNPSVVFRFSTALDFDTLKFGGETSTFTFVDVTPGGPRHGRRPRSRFFATTDRARYVCNHWLGIRPSEGSPLDPESTYAVVFRKGIRDARGRLLEPDRDLAAVVGEAEPDHPALRAIWNKYAPLRAWMREEGIPPGDVIGGTVFTTGNPVASVLGLRDAVQAAPPPQIEALTRCGPGVTSPCEAGGERTCGAANDAFDEYHGRVTLPVFQRGVPPYAERGGDVVQADGVIRRQRMESVCVAFTVPKGSDGRSPVALYAHDLGGHFRSFVVDGFAARMASLGWAVIGFDGVLHGPRAGEAPPGDAAGAAALLFNLKNPSVPRDTYLQAAADLMQLTRFARDVELEEDGRTLAFRRNAIAFFGHGFGAEAGTLFLALEPEVRAGVLAAGGGGMADRLRLTRAPFPVAAEVAQGLAEPEPNGMHPGLALMQTWLDPADPVNFGELLRAPPEGVPGKHVFLLAGIDDPVMPPANTNQLAIALRAERVGPELARMEAVPPVEGGVARGNVRVRGGDVTRAVRQYTAADGRDPHRVAFELPAATRDVEVFFESLLADPDGIPRVVP